MYKGFHEHMCNESQRELDSLKVKLRGKEDRLQKVQDENRCFRIAYGVEDTQKVVGGFKDGSLLLDTRGGSRMRVWQVTPKLVAMEKAAEDLLRDIHNRHPGEELHCKYLVELENSLNLERF